MDRFNSSFTVGEAQFSVPLFRKRLELGPAVVDHYWLNTSLLYGQRKSRSSIPTQIHQVYRAICQLDGAFEESDTRETYLLAALLPRMRANGSRRVFADAHLKLSRDDRNLALCDLDALVRTDDGSAIGSITFARSIWGSLGRSDLTKQEVSSYETICGELLEQPARLLMQDEMASLKLLNANWDSLQRRFGRRGHADEQKSALDVLSYEARAAFHRCYSALWCYLLPALIERFSLSEVTQRFTQLWHFEHGNDSSARFRVFHGGIFALHPATANLIQTESGKLIIGNFVADPASEDNNSRLLHAVLVATHHYASLRDERNLIRRTR